MGLRFVVLPHGPEAVSTHATVMAHEWVAVALDVAETYAEIVSVRARALPQLAIVLLGACAVCLAVALATQCVVTGTGYHKSCSAHRLLCASKKTD
jgi:hypothetical protein